MKTIVAIMAAVGMSVAVAAEPAKKRQQNLKRNQLQLHQLRRMRSPQLLLLRKKRKKPTLLRLKLRSK